MSEAVGVKSQIAISFTLLEYPWEPTTVLC